LESEVAWRKELAAIEAQGGGRDPAVEALAGTAVQVERNAGVWLSLVVAMGQLGFATLTVVASKRG